MATLLGTALRTARKLRGFTQKQVADFCGVTRVAVGQWESGASEPATINLINACEFLGVDLAAVTGGQVKQVATPVPDRQTGKVEIIRGFVDRRPEIRAAEEALSHLSPDSEVADLPPPRDIPVMETGVDYSLSDHGVFVGSFGKVIDFTRRPPAFESTKGILAMFVPTDAVAPRFEVGEMIFLWSARPPYGGDYVVVELNEKSGDGWVCRIFRYARTTADAIEGDIFYPAERIVIPLKSIRKVHRIIPWTQMFN